MNWDEALAGVTGIIVSGEERIASRALFQHLGIPYSDRAARRLKSVMRRLGWQPRKLRFGAETRNGYSRKIGAAVVQQALVKLSEILALPTERDDGRVLRAQTAAATTALNTQLRADEARLRQKRSDDTIAHLLEFIKQARAAREQEEAAGRASIVTLDPSDQADDSGEGADSPSEKT